MLKYDEQNKTDIKIKQRERERERERERAHTHTQRINLLSNNINIVIKQII